MGKMLTPYSRLTRLLHKAASLHLSQRHMHVMFISQRGTSWWRQLFTHHFVVTECVWRHILWPSWEKSTVNQQQLQRVICGTVVLVWKCVRDVAPAYPYSSGALHRSGKYPAIQTSSTGCIQLPRVRTLTGQRSFTFRGLAVWNCQSVTEHFQQLETESHTSIFGRRPMLMLHLHTCIFLHQLV